MPETRPYISFLLTVLLLTAPSLQSFHSPPEADGQASRVFKQVRSALNRIKPFKVLFVQQLYSDDQMDLQESGEIIFRDSQQLKWTYLEPDYKVFLLEGDNYKFYDEDNEQLIIGKVKEKDKQWIWQLLFADDILPYARWNKASRTLQVKDDARSLNIEIRISEAHLPVYVSQEDPSGVRMVYRFKEYRPGINVSDDMFQIKVPTDVEILRR
jgi:outer membrane lipoprotein-sorting protein